MHFARSVVLALAAASVGASAQPISEISAGPPSPLVKPLVLKANQEELIQTRTISIDREPTRDETAYLGNGQNWRVTQSKTTCTLRFNSAEYDRKLAAGRVFVVGSVSGYYGTNEVYLYTTASSGFYCRGVSRDDQSVPFGEVERTDCRDGERFHRFTLECKEKVKLVSTRQIEGRAERRPIFGSREPAVPPRVETSVHELDAKNPDQAKLKAAMASLFTFKASEARDFD